MRYVSSNGDVLSGRIKAYYGVTNKKSDYSSNSNPDVLASVYATISLKMLSSKSVSM